MRRCMLEPLLSDVDVSLRLLGSSILGPLAENQTKIREIYTGMSILRRLGGALDHQQLQRRLRSFQLEPELSLQRGEHGRRVGFGIGGPVGRSPIEREF